MAKPIGRLAKVAVEPPKGDSFTLILTDEHKKVFRTALTPEGLNALFPLLTECIGLWAAKPAVAVDTLVGPKNSIVAQKIAFQKGRNSAEVAVRMRLGDKLEMVFLMPLDALSLALLELDRTLASPPAGEATNH
jgi:hypothetical protein